MVLGYVLPFSYPLLNRVLHARGANTSSNVLKAIFYEKENINHRFDPCFVFPDLRPLYQDCSKLAAKQIRCLLETRKLL